MFTEHPLVLLVLLAAIIVASFQAQVRRRVLGTLAISLPFAAVITGINAIMVRDGITVLFRAGSVPLLGRMDITAEACIYGAVLGLRALVVVAAGALFSAAVSSDELLRCARRFSVRPVVTVALALRMVPLMVRDGRRIFEAQRCRSTSPGWQLAVIRTIIVGALERATELAATLEVRGYGLTITGGQEHKQVATKSQRASHSIAMEARFQPNFKPIVGFDFYRRLRAACSRHDIAFGLTGVTLLAFSLGGFLFGWVEIVAYPRTVIPLGVDVLLLSLALLLVALFPFTDRRGISA